MKIYKRLAALVLIAGLAVGAVGCTKEVESITLDKTKLEVVHGENFTLTATIFPDDAEDKTVSWSITSSDNNAVVPVTAKQNTLKKEFSAANVGEATVVISSSNGEERRCYITVTENETDIEERQKAEEEAKIAAEKKAEEDRIAAEKKAEEERIAAEKKAEEERIGYETGITYDQLVRTPDDYMGKKVKFYGSVFNVHDYDTISVATRRSPVMGMEEYYTEDIIHVEYNPSILSSRILQDDMVTIYGTSNGLNGKLNPKPLIIADKIEINQ